MFHLNTSSPISNSSLKQLFQFVKLFENEIFFIWHPQVSGVMLGSREWRKQGFSAEMQFKFADLEKSKQLF